MVSVSEAKQRARELREGVGGNRVSIGGGVTVSESLVGEGGLVKRSRVSRGISTDEAQALRERERQARERRETVKVEKSFQEQLKKQELSEKRESIQSRTIAGQIPTPPKFSGTVQDSFRERATGEVQPTGPTGPLPTRSQLGSERGFFKGIGEDALSFGRGLFNVRTQEDITPPSQILDIGGPSQQIIDISQRGTTTGLGLPPSQIKTKTSAEREREEFVAGGLSVPAGFQQEKISRGISKRAESQFQQTFGGLQEQVSSGQITVPQAEQRLKVAEEKLQKQTEREFQTETEKLLAPRRRAESLIGFRETGETSGFEFVRAGGTIGLFLAGPATGGLSTAVATGLGGAEFLSSVKEETTLQKGLTATGGALIGFGGAGSVFVQSARAVDKATLEALFSKKGVILGEEVRRGPKGSLFELTGVKKTGEATLKVKQKLPVFKTGPDEFAITGGKGTSELEFFSLEQKGLVTFKDQFGVFGRGEISEQAPKLLRTGLKDFESGVRTSLPGAKGGFGSGGIIRGGKIESFKFGGLSAPTEKAGVQEILGGNVEKLRFNLATGNKEVIIRPGSRGFLKLFAEADEGVKFIRPGKIAKTPLSQTFQQQQVGGGVVGITSKSLDSSTKSIIKQLPTGSGKQIGLSGGVIRPEVLPPGQRATTSSIFFPKGRQIFDDQQFIGGIKEPTSRGFLSRSLVRKDIVSPITGIDLGISGKSKTNLISGSRLSEELISTPSSSLLPSTRQFEKQLTSQAQDLGLSTKQSQKLQLQFEGFPSSTFPTPSPRGFFAEGGFVPLAFPPPLLNLGSARKRKTKGKKVRTRLGTSLTGTFVAQTQDIFGELPKELKGFGGVSPFSIRLVSPEFKDLFGSPRRRSTKSKKKK